MPIDNPVIEPPSFYAAMKMERAVIERVLSYAEVDRECRREAVATGHPDRLPPPGKWFQGCTITHPDRCIVYRVNSRDVLVHELAHCKGWPADHPGGKLP